MIQFKLNGKKVQVATSWDDLSFNQYLQIQKLKDDYLQLVSVCSGIDYEILKKAEIIGLESVLEAVKFISKPPVIPETVSKIGKYTIPVDSKGQFNVQFKRLDQFEDMRKIMANAKDIHSVTDSFPQYLAIYLQHIRDGEYSYQKAMDMVPEIRELPALQVISLGSFFLIKLLNLSSGTAKTSQSTAPKQKKLKPASRNSKRNLVRTRR
jgi:hypothetical protein